MKGAMSEAELHVLRARLRGGILNQVQRAALKLQLPVGLVYARCRYRPARSRCPGPTSLVHLVCHRSLGQDQPGQWSNIFANKDCSFRAVSVLAPMQEPFIGHRSSTIPCGSVLRNPRYAGAFCYGRTHSSKRLDGRLRVETVPKASMAISLPERPCWLHHLGRL